MSSDKKLRILLVDDDRFLLDMYSIKFKKAGCEIDTSASSATALEKLREKNEFDIIVLDIIMPGMDGVELLKTIKDEKIASQSTIIMLTNEMDGAQKAKEAGVDGYIIKATATPSEVVEQTISIYENKNKK